MPETIQEPTVGRIVHFFEYGAKIPFPAMVVSVTPGALTIGTLTVFRHDGIEALENVRHKSEVKGDGYCWDWMAYQKGQAAKAETLQGELNEAAVRLQQSYKSTHGSPIADDRELTKNQSSTPSPVDGKR